MTTHDWESTTHDWEFFNSIEYIDTGLHVTTWRCTACAKKASGDVERELLSKEPCPPAPAEES